MIHLLWLFVIGWCIGYTANKLWYMLPENKWNILWRIMHVPPDPDPDPLEELRQAYAAELDAWDGEFRQATGKTVWALLNPEAARQQCDLLQAQFAAAANRNAMDAEVLRAIAAQRQQQAMQQQLGNTNPGDLIFNGYSLLFGNNRRH